MSDRGRESSWYQAEVERLRTELEDATLLAERRKWDAEELDRVRTENKRLQAVLDAALAWDAETFPKRMMRWHQVDRDLHDSLAPFRDGEVKP